MQKTAMLSRHAAHSVDEAKRAVAMLGEEKQLTFMEDAACMIADVFSSNNKVIVAGNGGSLCDAMHFAEELTGFFRQKRKALPAIALSDPGHITCTGNDVGFEQIFARGVEAYGQPGDLFIALTTSGSSKNILLACQTAKALGLRTIAFLGRDGGKLRGAADLEMIISGFDTSDRIQEAHMAAMHIIIELVEYKLFS